MLQDVIDNLQTHLCDAVRSLLSQSERAHFAIGFFFLSGFKAIAKELDSVKELRLLIGNTSERETVEQLAETHRYVALIQAQQRETEFLSPKQRAARIAVAAQKIRARIERLDPTDEDQALVRQLVRLISEERLKAKFTPVAASTPKPTSSITPLADSSTASRSSAVQTFPWLACTTTPS